MGRFFIWVAGFWLWVAAAEKPPVLLRVHLQAPEGAKGMVTVPVTLINPPETIAIHSLPEVSEKEVEKVVPQPDGNIRVEFDAFGGTKLEAATSTGQGLVLVVIVNGRVVYAPTIDTVLSRGVLLLPPQAVSPEEIQQLNDQKNKERAQKLQDLPRS